jgi:hypothetical protein
MMFVASIECVRDARIRIARKACTVGISCISRLLLCNRASSLAVAMLLMIAREGVDTRLRPENRFERASPSANADFFAAL